MTDDREGLWAYRRLCEKFGIPDGMDEVAWLRTRLELIPALEARIAQLESFVPVRGRLFEAIKEMFRALQAFEGELLREPRVERHFITSVEARAWIARAIQEAHRVEGGLGEINDQVLAFTEMLTSDLPPAPTPEEVEHAKDVLKRHLQQRPRL